VNKAPPEPTSEQCTKNALIKWRDEYCGTELTGFACWYPQMGGYGAHCVIEPGGRDARHPEDGADRCFEAWVWHDGEFPFGDEQKPAHLHHCLAGQFVTFGQTVMAKLRELP
jgi:hypothetical protein